MKHRLTTEAIIGGVTGRLDAPRTLILDRYGRGGRLRVVARSVPLASSARFELAGLLSPRRASTIPGPPSCRRAWGGGLPGAQKPIRYTRVVPDVVVEITVDDAAFEHGRWRHAARFVRARSDLTPPEIPQGLDIE